MTTSEDIPAAVRRKYWGTIERLVALGRKTSLIAEEQKEFDDIAYEHGWDGLSCACGGGWLAGHLAGCPEAEVDRRPDRAEVLREALKDALKDAAYAPGDHPVVPLKLAAFVERVRALSSPSREPTTQSTSQGK